MYLYVCYSEACYSSERYLKYDLKKRVAVSDVYTSIMYTVYTVYVLYYLIASIRLQYSHLIISIVISLYSYHR